MNEELETLLAGRVALFDELARIDDMRQGSITENYRRCGKSGCRCAIAGHPGHGPYYAYTRKVDGKTKTINLRPGARLRKLRREITNYQRFRQLCRKLLAINEQICDARPIDYGEDGETTDY